jgi:galactose-1-phosphate uridylyltransferase
MHDFKHIKKSMILKQVKYFTQPSYGQLNISHNL